MKTLQLKDENGHPESEVVESSLHDEVFMMILRSFDQGPSDLETGFAIKVRLLG